MRVWDDVCVECGARQSDVIAGEQAKVEELHTQSKSHQHEYQQDEALTLLQSHERIEHSALTGSYEEIDGAVESLKAVQAGQRVLQVMFMG